MNFNKIKTTIEKSHKLKYFIPGFTEMHVDGFRLALKKGTLKVTTLEKISKALGLPMSYWWKDEEINVVESPKSVYGEPPSAIINRLNKQIEQLMDDKERLKRDNDELREKMGIRKVGT